MLNKIDNKIDMTELSRSAIDKRSAGLEDVSRFLWTGEQLVNPVSQKREEAPYNSSLGGRMGSRLDALETSSSRAKSHLNDMYIVGLEGGRNNYKDSSENLLGQRSKQTDKVEVLEFRGLKNTYRNDAEGGKTAPDATVIIPKGFDPNKPVNVVFFNHGHFGSGKDWAEKSRLTQQMAAADPNTIMVIPEWQTRPGTQDNTRTASSQPNFYRNQLQEIFNRTPQLQGRTVDNIKSISIIAHAAGVNPAKSQLNDNGFGDKVKSVTVLDAMYVPDAYDSWVRSNAQDIASGRKQLTVVYRGDRETTSGVPRRELMERHVKRALGQYQVPDSSYDRAKNTDPTMRPRSGVVFTYDADHMGLPAKHVARALENDRRRQTQFA